MIKNVASQYVGVQMVSATDGSAFTGTVSCVITKDGGSQGAAGGSVTHKGNGYHSLACTQADTNADHLAFTFTGSGAIPATVQVYTSVALANAAHGGTAATLTLERVIVASTTTNQPAVRLTGNGYGEGLDIIGGVNANGVEVNPGANGAYGLALYGHASAGAGLYLAGSRGMESAGPVYIQNGSTAEPTLQIYNGSGYAAMKLTGTPDLDADITGNITGNLSGSVNSVTSGVTLADGAHGGSSAVLTLERVVVDSTTSGQPGVKITGEGTGAGVSVTGGLSANGVEVVGSVHGLAIAGGTQHGVYVTTTGQKGVQISGPTGMNINGVSAEGLTVTGATGEIVADITGNISGNLSGSVGLIDEGGIQQGSFAAGAIDAAAIATDAIGSNELAASAVSKIEASVGNAIIQGDIWSVLVSTANEVSAVLEDTGTTLPATLAGLNDLSAAEVATEIADALRTDTGTELSAVPAAAAPLADQVQFIYQKIRNSETQTSSAATIKKDDGTTIGTSTSSDNGTTYTKGKYT